MPRFEPRPHDRTSAARRAWPAGRASAGDTRCPCSPPRTVRPQRRAATGYTRQSALGARRGSPRSQQVSAWMLPHSPTVPGHADLIGVEQALVLLGALRLDVIADPNVRAATAGASERDLLDAVTQRDQDDQRVAIAANS